MIKKTSCLFFLIFILCASSLSSQNFWNSYNKKNPSQKNEILDRKNSPKEYTLASLNLTGFKNHINLKSKNSQTIITLPNAKGVLKRFSIKETSYLAPGLAAKFPMIKTYAAQGIDNPSDVAKITIGTDGLHAIIFTRNESTIYIDPYTKNKKEYIIYHRKDISPTTNDFICKIKNTAKKDLPNQLNRNANDGKLRTYRIAIACTGEYSQFHLEREGIPASATDFVKKSTILSAINTTMVRVNSVYEKDLSVRMVIVDDNEKLIFLDPDTDDLTNDSSSSLIDESQVKCDDIIGNANYDIGHTFSTGGGGLATLNSVCADGYKARGITGRSQPIGDPFDIDYVAHELGHQFGATHTFNGTAGNCGGNISATSVEPGSGTTIMAYAGICDPQNVQNNSDDYFHAINIAQMWNHVQSVASCGTTTDTGNSAPTANAGNDVSIPKSTPFVLKATATDAQGVDKLTYIWEQIDPETATLPLVSTATEGPVFRSLPPTLSPNRYFPTLANVINATSNEWEVLPSVARELNFALTVRDNHVGGGNSARDDVKITVIDTEAFTVTAPNTAVAWDTGDTQTITWNKGTTTEAPINCSKVNIKLSIDGGLTFPILLKENTENDGTEKITVPNHPTTKARIMVEAADNIFYNVNATDFTINSTIPTFLITNNTEKQTVCNTGGKSISYTLNFDFINGFNEAVTLTAANLPNGAKATFNPTTINTDGNVVMTINNLNNSNQGEYNVNVKATSTSITQNTDALVTVIGNNFSTITAPILPINKTNDISIIPRFEWPSDANATSYTIFVADDVNFSNIIVNETTTTNSYNLTVPLAKVTKYYWRIKPKNDCGEGANSATWEFTTETPSYCKSSFINNETTPEHITNVTFNTINNDSEVGVDGYEDFTAVSTEIERTEPYEISVTFRTEGYQDHCYVFIDWNQDYQFDKETERYDLGSKEDAIATTTFNITVPENAALGATRMRVIIEYYDRSTPYGEGACASDHRSIYGETEDYTLNIKDNFATDETLFTDLKIGPVPFLSSENLKVKFKQKTKDLTIIRLFSLTGQLIDTQTFTTASSKFDKEIQFTKASSGMYFLQIENGGRLKTKTIIIK